MGRKWLLLLEEEEEAADEVEEDEEEDVLGGLVEAEEDEEEEDVRRFSMEKLDFLRATFDVIDFDESEEIDGEHDEFSGKKGNKKLF